jgi:hypothetical protein
VFSNPGTLSTMQGRQPPANLVLRGLSGSVFTESKVTGNPSHTILQKREQRSVLVLPTLTSSIISGTQYPYFFVLSWCPGRLKCDSFFYFDRLLFPSIWAPSMYVPVPVWNGRVLHLGCMSGVIRMSAHLFPTFDPTTDFQLTPDTVHLFGVHPVHSNFR